MVGQLVDNMQKKRVISKFVMIQLQTLFSGLTTSLIS